MRRAPVLVLALVLAACGDSTPTRPTPPPPPPPIPAASLILSGQASFGTCLAGSCILNASIQNVGAGCATNTALVARLFNASGAQVGSDVQMGAVGTSLAARVIRPQEIVAVASVTLVASPFPSQASSIRLFPVWNDVRC